MIRALCLIVIVGSACGSPQTPDYPNAPASDLQRSVIRTEAAPGAIGPYSQAIRAGNHLYLSGQVGLDPSTGALVPGGIESETRRTLENCRIVLETAGSSLADVVQAQVFLADLADYSAMNAVYATYFADQPPARAAVQVARLPLDARVEIMLTAVVSH